MDRRHRESPVVARGPRTEHVEWIDADPSAFGLQEADSEAHDDDPHHGPGRVGGALGVVVLLGLAGLVWHPWHHPATIAVPPPVVDAHGSLLATGTSHGTEYALRLRIDAAGLTFCEEAVATPDTARCDDSTSTTLPGLGVWTSGDRRWVYAVLAEPHETDGVLLVARAGHTTAPVALVRRGALAWPTAAVLVGPDDTTAELRTATYDRMVALGGQ